MCDFSLLFCFCFLFIKLISLTTTHYIRTIRYLFPLCLFLFLMCTNKDTTYDLDDSAFCLLFALSCFTSIVDFVALEGKRLDSPRIYELLLKKSGFKSLSYYKCVSVCIEVCMCVIVCVMISIVLGIGLRAISSMASYLATLPHRAYCCY